MAGHEVGSTEWVNAWCVEHLGSGVAAPLHESQRMSAVHGVRLKDGREVAVKLRYADAGRTVTCVAVQHELASRGFPCPRPVSEAIVTDGVAVHAEEWMPGGDMIRSDGVAHAVLSGRLLANLMTKLENVAIASPPLPNPVWVQWDFEGALFPPHSAELDRRAAARLLPGWLVEVTVRVRERIARSPNLRPVLGHADWEAQNLRWMGDEPHAVHDWDSLAWLPEAAMVGAASGAFASEETPTLAPVESSRAFLEAYQETRGRHFTKEEAEVAWAASVFPAAHNVRGEYLFDVPLVAWGAL
jgi:Ser/Thr protein kinase RdoA (MazF antagonist)